MGQVLVLVFEMGRIIYEFLLQRQKKMFDRKIPQKLKKMSRRSQTSNVSPTIFEKPD